jgi:hypothetical protein
MWLEDFVAQPLRVLDFLLNSGLAERVAQLEGMMGRNSGPAGCLQRPDPGGSVAAYSGQHDGQRARSVRVRQ